MDLGDILPTGFTHTYISIQAFLEDFGKREHKNKKWAGRLEKWAKDIDAGLEHVLWDFFMFLCEHEAVQYERESNP